MKNLAFVFILILIATLSAFAQNNKSEIEIQQAFGGNKYFVNGKHITMKQMVKLMQYDDAAYASIKSGKAQSTGATILGITGGVLIGYNIGAAIASRYNGSVKWTYAIIGGALILISIPISISGTKNTLNAVKIYNANLTAQSFRKVMPQFSIGFTGTGLGMMLKF